MSKEQDLKNRMYTASREYDFAAPKSEDERRAKSKYQHAARKLKRLQEAQSTDSNQ